MSSFPWVTLGTEKAHKFHLSFGILAEATSTLIKQFSIVYFLNLCYIFITYEWLKSNEKREKSSGSNVL